MEVRADTSTLARDAVTSLEARGYAIVERRARMEQTNAARRGTAREDDQEALERGITDYRTTG